HSVHVRRTAIPNGKTYGPLLTTVHRHNVSCRVHDVKVHPVLSPQGATIIIYGHENGVSLLWRGGRRFKQKAKPAPAPVDKRNGASDDAVMIIDSDDDVPASKTNEPFVDNPEFEDEVPDEP